MAPPVEAHVRPAVRWDKDTSAWLDMNIRGPTVALVGCPDLTYVLTLLRRRQRIAAYLPNPSLLDQWLTTLAEEDRQAVDVSSINALSSGEQTTSADTVIVIGWPTELDGPDGVIGSVRDRVGGIGRRLILVLTDFEVLLREHEFDIAEFVGEARRCLLPTDISFVGETLLFAGEFGEPDAEAWNRFEQHTWPGLLGNAVLSIGSRNRRQVAGLRQRLSRLRGLISSTSYKVGIAVVTAANRPRTLWRLPATLWRLYRTRRNRPSVRKVVMQEKVEIPSMPLPSPVRSGRPVVAAILDAFSDHCLRYELDLLRLSPEQWHAEMEASDPAFLLVESAWVGNEGRWRGLIVHNQSVENNPLRELLEYCESKQIPTVFWNKEDPPNFDFFIAAARQFDIIFTSDYDCVPEYREVCGHDRVFVMPFAAQPRIHNPCREPGWPRYPVCFAGGWKGDAYTERTDSIAILLDPALSFGLHIMDRNLRRADTRPNFRFPDRYQPTIKGSLNYQEMLTAYRCYDVMLNANSVTESPTMFSRRVFESMACATPVVSLDSVGMREMLGSHVRIARSKDETVGHLEELLNDPEKRLREGHLGYRHVHQNHTYRHRVNKILEETGLGTSSTGQLAVSVIVALRNPENLASIIADYTRQKYRKKELIVVLSTKGMETTQAVSAVRKMDGADVIFVDVDATLSERLSCGVEEAKGEYIAIVNDAYRYGENYISDMMLAANFSDSEILGKGTYFTYDRREDKMAVINEGNEHAFGVPVAFWTMVVETTVLRVLPLEGESSEGVQGFFARASKEGFRTYSADRFNYLEVCGDSIRPGAMRSDGPTETTSKGMDGLEMSRVMI